MFRRKFPQRRTAGNFRSRSRGPRALGQVKNRITTMQRCQFTLRDDDVLAPVTSGVLDSTTFAFEITKIVDHIADFSTDSGVAMAGIVRSIDISRIHFDYGIGFEFGGEDAGTYDYNNSRWLCHTALAVSRLNASGIPEGVADTQWFTNQTPTAAIGAALLTQLEAEFHWPTRVLWERTESLDFGSRQIVDTTEGTLYAPNGQQVRGPRSGYVSKRIRTRITDEQGLYLIISVANRIAGAPSVRFAFWAHGSYYYKVNI